MNDYSTWSKASIKNTNNPGIHLYIPGELVEAALDQTSIEDTSLEGKTIMIRRSALNSRTKKTGKVIIEIRLVEE